MRRNLRSLATVVLAAIGAGACAQIAGLPDFSTGDPQVDSSVPTRRPKDAAADEPAVSDDQSPTDDQSPVDEPDGEAPDDAQDGDAATEPGEGGGPSDANEIPDGYVCNTNTCGGCCDHGNCVGGQSVATCGVDGVSCKDCTSSGACSSGSCSTPPVEAGPPPKCMVSTCTNHCSGAPIQGVCCKSDNTCGCQWTAFAPCN